MKNLTDITLIVDRSSSMSSIAEATREGVNSFIQQQRQIPGDAVLTLVYFCSKSETVISRMPLSDVPLLTEKNYMPTGTSTALRDAVADAIDERGSYFAGIAEEQRPNKVLFVIMTDGLENSSKKHEGPAGLAALRAKVSHQREKYAWQFVFLGANQDAVLTADSMGMDKTNALTYAHNPAGTRKAMFAASAACANYRNNLSSAIPAEFKAD